MSSTKLNALVAFLYQQSDGLRTIRSRSELPLAIAALKQATEERVVTPSELVVMANHDNVDFRMALMDVLVEHFKDQSDADHFALSIANLSRHHHIHPEEFSGPKYLELFARPDVFEELIPVAKNPDHPLHDRLNSDAYWKQRVGHHLVKKDWERAWDDLKSARLGFVLDGQKPKDVMRGDAERAYAASKEVLAELVYELYQGMREESLISPVPESEFKLAEGDAKVTEIVYQPRTYRGVHHRMVRRKERRRLPGLDFARQFRIDGSNSNTFTREGGMILAIAAYFSKRDNDKRRDRMARKLMAKGTSAA